MIVTSAHVASLSPHQRRILSRGETSDRSNGLGTACDIGDTRAEGSHNPDGGKVDYFDPKRPWFMYPRGHFLRNIRER